MFLLVIAIPSLYMLAVMAAWHAYFLLPNKNKAVKWMLNIEEAPAVLWKALYYLFKFIIATVHVDPAIILQWFATKPPTA